jgi:hypothetical protein
MSYFESVDEIDDIHPPVLKALRKIPSLDRKVLELLYYEDLGYDEMSGETGLDKGIVKEKEISAIEKLTDALRSLLDAESISHEEARKAIRRSGERLIELSEKRLSEEKIERAKEEIEDRIER